MDSNPNEHSTNPLPSSNQLYRPYLPRHERRTSRRSRGGSSYSYNSDPHSQIQRIQFGDIKHSQPLFRDIEWTVKEGERWAVVDGGGGGEKNVLFNTLLGRYRISPHPPPPGGLFPFLTLAGRDPYSDISIVSFGHRSQGGGGGEFYDYSARYGAVQEQDRLTLRQSLFPETIPPPSHLSTNDTNEQLINIPKKEKDEENALFKHLITKMGLESFLDLPMIALSNGQTRRARIIKAILRNPSLLLLDEPLTGLDATTRPLLLSTLRELHDRKSPRVILGLRAQDEVPEWVHGLVYLYSGTAIVGGRDSVLREVEKRLRSSEERTTTTTTTNTLNAEQDPLPSPQLGELLIDMKNIRVQYKDRKVLDGLSWQIKQGERWHLIGENGSGKTTLLSLITGDHPQSYTQTRYAAPSSESSTSTPTTSHLNLFSRPRSRLPTTLLRSAISTFSPELFDAFPRRANMSVWDVVGTGFDGDFVPKGKKGVGSGVGMKVDIGEGVAKGRGEGGCEGAMEGQDEWKEEEQWRVERVWEVLEALGPEAWSGSEDSRRKSTSTSAIPAPGPSPLTKEFAKTSFPSLPISQQRIVLLMRALVGRAPLILLDEVWSGMDERMVRAARGYLRGDLTSGGGGGVGPHQAVVVITHWEEEVPWSRDEDPGVFKRFKLSGGKGFEQTNQTDVLAAPDLPSVVQGMRQICAIASTLLGSAVLSDGVLPSSTSSTAAAAASSPTTTSSTSSALSNVLSSREAVGMYYLTTYMMAVLVVVGASQVLY
ncbi:hypothetical protein D9757_008161 [Collybiopsis confluens]|uniref:ABC transporter domain-containing protein n=1 Tax=Collybiopsis confluens TaxID=2823264 RepID=A0A8H5M5I0_9AGAR|nr:hypothetical protein D9757_008161 [Collybiopsis confluens]